MLICYTKSQLCGSRKSNSLSLIQFGVEEDIPKSPIKSLPNGQKFVAQAQNCFWLQIINCFGIRLDWMSSSNVVKSNGK